MTEQYRTEGGILVERHIEMVQPAAAVESLIDRLDTRRGVLLSSSYEYPGRYTRWDLGFVDPPIAVVASGRTVRVDALNERGEVLLVALRAALGVDSTSNRPEYVESTSNRPLGFDVVVARPGRRFEEEERSRQPSVFSVVRTLIELFRSPEDPDRKSTRLNSSHT